MRHRPRHPLPTILGAALLAAACVDRSPTDARIGAPSALVSDGAHEDGNPDFFFLPPLVDDPSTNIFFEKGDFNPNLLPEVRVCKLSELDAEGNPACGDDVLLPPGPFPRQPAPLVQGEEHYKYEWNTAETNLDPTQVYRIFAMIGDREMGFADVQPVDKGMKKVKTGEEFEFQDGRTLPVRMRFENDALCGDGGGSDDGFKSCLSETIVLADGGVVVLRDVVDGQEVVDYVEIPAQGEDDPRIITVTLERCDEDLSSSIDLPLLSRCLTATADPPLAKTLDGELNPRATVALCSAVPVDDLQPYKTMYRRDADGTIHALPHADSPLCAELEGSGDLGSAARRSLFELARAHLVALAHRLGPALVPTPLHAGMVVLDVGDAGSTEFFSDFQFVLPAQMEPLPGTDGQTAAAGEEVENPPGVLVFLPVSDGEVITKVPVGGARVRFAVTEGDGFIDDGSGPVIVFSNATTGEAKLNSWSLGSEPGVTNIVTATGRGIAGPERDGPFIPPIHHDPDLNEDESAVLVLTGEVPFTATALTGTVEIESVVLSSTTLTIDGPGVPYTSTINNGTGSSIPTVALQAWMDQGETSRAAGGVVVLCGEPLGTLPQGTCSFAFTTSASNLFTTAGIGTLTPDRATARFELFDDETTLDVFTVPVTLITAPVRILAVDLASTTFVLGGDAVAFTAILTNETEGTVSDITLEAKFRQSGVVRSGGQAVPEECGELSGDLAPGECSLTSVVSASNTSEGSGTLEPGEAALLFELKQAGTLLHMFAMPVTLVVPL